MSCVLPYGYEHLRFPPCVRHMLFLPQRALPVEIRHQRSQCLSLGFRCNRHSPPNLRSLLPCALHYNPVICATLSSVLCPRRSVLCPLSSVCTLCCGLELRDFVSWRGDMLRFDWNRLRFEGRMFLFDEIYRFAGSPTVNRFQISVEP